MLNYQRVNHGESINGTFPDMESINGTCSIDMTYCKVPATNFGLLDDRLPSSAAANSSESETSHRLHWQKPWTGGLVWKCELSNSKGLLPDLHVLELLPNMGSDYYIITMFHHFSCPSFGQTQLFEVGRTISRAPWWMGCEFIMRSSYTLGLAVFASSIICWCAVLLRITIMSVPRCFKINPIGSMYVWYIC